MNWPGLEIYNESSPQDVRERALRENFSRLGSILGKSGVNLLASGIEKTEYASIGATESVIQPLSKGITTSGGLVMIAVLLDVNVSSGTHNAKLYVDGALVSSRLAASASTTNFTTVLFYVGNLAPGGHKIEVTQFSNPAGTSGLNNSSVWAGLHQSEMYVVEFLF